MKLLPRYMGILKHHLVNKLEIKESTSVLFEILRSLYASQQAVCNTYLSAFNNSCHRDIYVGLHSGYKIMATKCYESL